MPVSDAKILDIPRHEDTRGSVAFLEQDAPLPFTLERVYYLYGVRDGQTRGGHAHKKLEQIIIAVSGSFTIHLDDGREKASFVLNHPSKGLYVPAMTWRDMEGFSDGAVCLVLASRRYEEEDYYRDYNSFLDQTRSQ